MNEYNETESFPTEIFDINTLKLLDMVCEGVDVPSDEDIEEAAIAHGEKEEVWMLVAILLLFCVGCIMWHLAKGQN